MRKVGAVLAVLVLAGLTACSEGGDEAQTNSSPSATGPDMISARLAALKEDTSAPDVRCGAIREETDPGAVATVVCGGVGVTEWKNLAAAEEYGAVVDSLKRKHPERVLFATSPDGLLTAFEGSESAITSDQKMRFDLVVINLDD